MEEQTVWEGSPSQMVNLDKYLLCTLTFFLIVPVFVALWIWVATRCRRYQVTTERVNYSTGVFSRLTEALELYRVKDIRLEEPFVLRMFGLGNIVLITSDRTTPEFQIEAVSNGADLRDEIRKYVELRRDRKRVREVDFE